MRRGVAAGVGGAALLLASTAAAQVTVPGPADEVWVKPELTLDQIAALSRLSQDRLDLRTRSTLDVGSGARAYGMAGAFLARADDATAASWNPAGLSYLRRPEFSLVGARNSYIRTELRSSDFLESEEASGRGPDFVAATYPISLGSTSGAVQVSYQRVVNFTTERSLENPDITVTGESEGGFDVVALGTGLRVTRWLRVGGTLNRWMNGYTQTLVREPQPGRGRPRVDHSTDYGLSGWNANVGLIWEPLARLNLGVVGKTPFTGDVDLSRERVDINTSGSGYTSNSFQSDQVRLDFPGAFGVGASWRPKDVLTVSVDYTRTFWSKARVRNFFTLAPATDEGAPSPKESGDVWAELPYPTLTVGALDTEQIRVGVEYVIIGDRARWPIRAGYFNDRQPNPGATATADGVKIVAPRFNGFTLGAGIGVGPLLLDVAYLRESGEYVDPSLFPQTVTTQRYLVSIIYRHLVRR
jgi:long-chain fatty acid transport protein